MRRRNLNIHLTLLRSALQGTLIQHLKEHVLHGNMTSSDVIFYYTTVGRESAVRCLPLLWAAAVFRDNILVLLKTQKVLFKLLQMWKKIQFAKDFSLSDKHHVDFKTKSVDLPRFTLVLVILHHNDATINELSL